MRGHVRKRARFYIDLATELDRHAGQLSSVRRGGFLRLLLRLLRRGGLLDTSHDIRPPLTEAFGIKLPNEFWQRQLPWLLVMVVQLSELLWVQPQLTCHLHVLMRQMELASCIDPRLQVC